MEIARCFLYFPFDYYFISSVNWEIGRNEYLLINLTLWFVRAAHIVSITFWLFYQSIVFIQSKRNNSNEYEIAAKGDKDLESDTSSMIRRNKYQTIILIFGILLGMMAMLISWMSRMDSCTQMFNEWNIA